MNNQELQTRKELAFARGQGNLSNAYIAKGKNSEVWDVEGKRFIDFGAGIAVVNTGHAHPKINQAVKEQVDAFSHTCVMINPYEKAVTLAERLNQVVPIDDAKAMFVTTGAEAVENAIKIARAHTKRSAVIAFNGGFHGRTNFCLGLTGKIMPYKKDFGPFPNEIYHIPFPVDVHGTTLEDTINSLEDIFSVEVLPQEVAAIIIEPIQGEGGFYQAPPELMRYLRKLCDEHSIVLIVDEIQTGFARTGKMFAMEHYEVQADLMTLAKGLAGGYPLAAVVGKAQIMDAPIPGGLGGTYGGSPVACAASLAVLEVIEEEKLCEAANKIGARFLTSLLRLQKQYPNLINDVRQVGAMVALELCNDDEQKSPNTKLTQTLIKQARQEGLILLSCGKFGNVIRFLTPLTIQDNILEEGISIFEKMFHQLST